MVTGESAPCIVRERIKQCLMCLLMCVYNDVRPTPNVNPLSTTSQKRARRRLNVIWNRQQRCAHLPATLICVQIAISISKYEWRRFRWRLRKGPSSNIEWTRQLLLDMKWISALNQRMFLMHNTKDFFSDVNNLELGNIRCQTSRDQLQMCTTRYRRTDFEKNSEAAWLQFRLALTIPWKCLLLV